MGNVELVEQYEFLGKEFLTYLWYLCDATSGTITFEDGTTIELSVGNSICLESEYGDVKKSTLKGDHPAISVEAKTSLSEGKQLAKARFEATIDNIEWKFTLDGKTLDLSSVQIPKVSAPSEESILVYRLRAFDFFYGVVDNLFSKFLEIRTNNSSWEREVAKISKWIEGV